MSAPRTGDDKGDRNERRPNLEAKYFDGKGNRRILLRYPNPARARPEKGHAMPLNASLLRSSFELVIQRQPELTARFYEILFERYPQVRPLFGRNSARKQQEMLAQALVAVLDHLEDASWLETTLAGMGAKHAEYGVTEAMYPWVGECLIATLSEVAGADWTPAMAEAWTAAFGAIRDLMLKGAAGRAA